VHTEDTKQKKTDTNKHHKTQDAKQEKSVREEEQNCYNTLIRNIK